MQHGTGLADWTFTRARAGQGVRACVEGEEEGEKTTTDTEFLA